jgi:predicted DNA-binding protein YlxM (UPF0122 family)
MARLTQEQWDKVKADYATGRYTLRELADMHNVSNPAIAKKVKLEGWIQLDQRVVSEYVQNQVSIKTEIEKVSKVSKVSSANLESSLNELAEFEVESNRRLALIDKKNMDLLEMAERPSDVKAIMETHIKHREARLGKSPETAIQINNGFELPKAIGFSIVDAAD